MFIDVDPLLVATVVPLGKRPHGRLGRLQRMDQLYFTRSLVPGRVYKTRFPR
jgi:hypothetical protein